MALVNESEEQEDERRKELESKEICPQLIKKTRLRKYLIGGLCLLVLICILVCVVYKKTTNEKYQKALKLFDKRKHMRQKVYLKV